MTTNQNIMVPAFRIANAEAGYRLARRMTGAVSKLHANTAPLSETSHMAPVNVDRREAQALADGKMGADGVFRATKIQAKCASKYEAAPGKAQPAAGRAGV